LDGRVTLQSATENAIVATRHLARRQFIWLRSEKDLNVLEALEPASVALIEQQIETLCAQLR
jgi:tRNA dimethylallyltransferase